MTVSSRELGKYERYSLTYTLTGHPAIVTYLASLASPPTPDRVRDAIAHLLDEYPLLRCNVPHPRAPHPHCAHNPALGASDVLRTVTSDAAATVILKSQLDDARDFDVRTGLLWRVTLYEGSSPRLALTISHVLSDGVGGRNLLGQLLHSIFSDTSISSSSSRVVALPPPLEETIDVHPGYLKLAHTVFTKLLLPKIPSFLRPAQTPIWPNPTRVTPHTRESRVTVLQITPQDVQRLKTSARAHNVRTLQPVLYATAIAALSGALEGRPAHNVVCNTPISLRDSALGHPRATGNYVGDHTITIATLTPGLLFWEEARTYAASLKDPATLAEAKTLVGILEAFMPNPEVMPAPDKSGWEVWVEEQLDTLSPYRSSMEFSNLGLIEEGLGTHVKDVIFAQTPALMGASLCLNFISSRDGPLSIATSYRDGVFDDKLVEKMHEKFAAIVRTVAEDQVTEGHSFGDLI